MSSFTCFTGQPLPRTKDRLESTASNLRTLVVREDDESVMVLSATLDLDVKLVVDPSRSLAVANCQPCFRLEVDSLHIKCLSAMSEGGGAGLSAEEIDRS